MWTVIWIFIVILFLYIGYKIGHYMAKGFDQDLFGEEDED